MHFIYLSSHEFQETTHQTKDTRKPWTTDELQIVTVLHYDYIVLKLKTRTPGGVPEKVQTPWQGERNSTYKD